MATTHAHTHALRPLLLTLARTHSAPRQVEKERQQHKAEAEARKSDKSEKSAKAKDNRENKGGKSKKGPSGGRDGRVGTFTK